MKRLGMGIDGIQSLTIAVNPSSISKLWSLIVGL
jgi:hypothetical protein